MAQICTKSFVGWGFALGSLQRFPDSLAGLGGAGDGEGGTGGKRREGREGRDGVPECQNPELASLEFKSGLRPPDHAFLEGNLCSVS